MSRHCGKCDRTLRYDERDEFVQEQTPDRGTWGYQACPNCVAVMNGWPAPPPRIYPVGTRVPHHPQHPGQDLPICGLCRLALHEDEAEDPETIRLYAADVADVPWLSFVRDGQAFGCCRECLTLLKPRVLARLKAQGIVPETLPLWAFGGEAML